MNENVMLMRKAKNQLTGNWLNAAIGTLIYLVIMLIAGTTSFLEFLVVGPMCFGLYLFYACIADTHNSDFGLLFKGFSRFVETLVAGLLMSLIIGIGYILLIVPGIIASCGLALTYFIMIEDPGISGVDAMKKSWQLMNGHKWELFCLWLRFIGWMLLGIITVGIAFLWIQPYITVTTLNYYRNLRYGTY